MAEFQLVVSYTPWQTRLAVVGVVLFLPIWSLLAPMALAAFIVYILKDGSSCPPVITAFVCVSLLTVWMLGALLSAASEDTKIHINKNGINFPPFLMPKLRFRRNWSWDSLKTASIAGSGAERALLLGFADSVSLRLKLSDFKAEQLEELLLAVELWGRSCQRSQELIDYQREHQTKVAGLGQTKMWQEELGRRFSATTFVPLEPGRKLQNGHIKVVRQLAFGGLSAIYLVQKDQTETYVLKEAVVPANADAEARASAEGHLAREAQMLFCLYHPNIARVIDHFVEDERHYLLMEYIHGQDLRALIKQNGPVKESQAISWAKHIAGILKFLHGQQPPIIHRDLTPDNLVLKNDGSICLIDFGASNEFIGTATGTLVGKQAYIAPEQLRGKAVPQSDFYALGCTLYYLLTARDPVPLAELDLKATLPDASDALCRLLKSLTAFEKQERIADAEAILQAIEQLPPAAPESKLAVTAGGEGQ